ncbi:MAG: Ppx/GppA family phosphatase [Frankiales bacterium]|nr:Ppx/GppA family phosphatase [Frankiales bacterium]
MRPGPVTTRVAAIDCGTNSIRLLIADIEGGALRDVERRMEIVRLGAGVDRTGRLDDAALQRTFAALDDYAEAIRRHGAQQIRMVATSATRDAANRADFVRGVMERIGVEPDVVTGAEEAALSFAGATRELAATGEVAAPFLVCDIGGGSTEFVLGDGSGVRAARSIDIGCVRMTERHLTDDPPTDEQIAAAGQDITAAVSEAAAEVDFAAAASLVGLAGSVTTVTAIALGLPSYDAARIHHARVSASDVTKVAMNLLAMSSAQRAALPVMHPGRADVIGAGALVLDTVMQVGGFSEVVASEHDILDGIAFSIVEA